MITLFFLSFSVALSGAMAPGPLLTYTIMQTIRQDRRGYLVGFWVVAGHAILEGSLLVLLLLGADFLFTSSLFVRVVAPLGGLFLIYLGIALLRDVLRKGAILTLPPAPARANPASSQAETNLVALRDKPGQEKPGNGKDDRPRAQGRPAHFNHPLLAGIFVSMSNPYWWGWWATAGLGLMLQQQISFRRWPELTAFFLGHEAGDLLWYLFVSIIVFLNRYWLTDRLYRLVLLVCSIVMVGFGLYLGIKPFFNS